MITIRKIKKEDGRLTSDIEISSQDNNTIFSLFIDVDKEYEQYLVTERSDAIVVGIIIYAMMNGHDVICEDPITSELYVMIQNQLIPTLAKHDKKFYNTVIYAKTEDEPIPNIGAVGTGNSLGTDSMCTIAQYYNSPSKELRLTHLLTSTGGVVGGYYQNNNWDFCSQKLMEKEKKVAELLGLPLIHVNTNLPKLYKIRADYYLEYWLVMLVMSLGKLFSTYFLSSDGADYSHFNVSETYGHACSSYALLLTTCSSISGGLRFISGGGELDRCEKIGKIAEFSVGRDNLQSCLTEHYNCMVCQKCKRNLVCMDAMGVLDKFSKSYDIKYYKQHRNDYIKYMCDQVNQGHGKYMQLAYDLIKKREPDLIARYTFSEEKMLSRSNELERQRNVYRNYSKIFRNSLKTKNFIDELRKKFEQNDIKKIIVYGPEKSYAVAFFKEILSDLNIEIVAVVENIKGELRYDLPHIPENTIEYPECDAIIVCNVDKPEIIEKKLSYFVNVPVYRFEDIMALRLKDKTGEKA